MLKVLRVRPGALVALAAAPRPLAPARGSADACDGHCGPGPIDSIAVDRYCEGTLLEPWAYRRGFPWTLFGRATRPPQNGTEALPGGRWQPSRPGTHGAGARPEPPSQAAQPVPGTNAARTEQAAVAQGPQHAPGASAADDVPQDDGWEEEPAAGLAGPSDDCDEDGDG